MFGVENNVLVHGNNAKKPIYKFSETGFAEIVSQVKNNLGPVVQNFGSLTVSLSPQFVNYISTSKANTRGIQKVRGKVLPNC